jgi:hypothetical protein
MDSTVAQALFSHCELEVDKLIAKLNAIDFSSYDGVQWNRCSFEDLSQSIPWKGDEDRDSMLDDTNTIVVSEATRTFRWAIKGSYSRDDMMIKDETLFIDGDDVCVERISPHTKNDILVKWASRTQLPPMWSIFIPPCVEIPPSIYCIAMLSTCSRELKEIAGPWLYGKIKEYVRRATVHNYKVKRAVAMRESFDKKPMLDEESFKHVKRAFSPKINQFEPTFKDKTYTIVCAEFRDRSFFFLPLYMCEAKDVQISRTKPWIKLCIGKDVAVCVGSTEEFGEVPCFVSVKVVNK